MGRHAFSALSSAFAACLLLTLSACGGGGGGGGSTPPPSPPVDTTAPDTTLSGAPAALTNATTASFTFTATEAGSTFEARLDGGTYATATSPVNLNGLGDGSHTYEVRARDGAGNIDATPASAAWVVDATAPDSEITQAPASNTPATSASFSFSSPDASATFEVSVDGSAFVAANSPYLASGIANGAHDFQVRARDAVGNLDATPASAAFIIDTAAPAGRIVFPPPVSYTEGTTLTVRGTATDATGISSVRVNGVLATSADAFATWSAQIPIGVSGANPIVLAVTDALGNEAASADTAVVHNRGPNILLVQGLAFDPSGDQLLIVDLRTSNLYAFNAGERLGRILADLGSLSSHPGSSFSGSIAVDAGNNRAIVAHGPSDLIAAVNLATGAVTVLSASPGAGQPTSMGFSPHVALDSANNRAFATTDGQTVLAIDLTTGARSIVTDGSVGSGVSLDLPAGIVYDNHSVPGVPRLLVSDANFSSRRIIAVDVATGARSAFSSSSPTGTGPALVSPTSLQLDAANNRLLAMDVGAHALVAVSLSNGNRSYLAGSGAGTGATMNTQAGVALSPSGRIYLGNQGGEVLELDPGTGVRTVFAGTPVGTGPRILAGRALILESVESLLYLDYVRESVLRVNLLTGNRSVVSSFDTSVGTGPRLMFAADMVLDRRAPSPGSRVFVTAGYPTDTLMSVDLATGDRSAVTYLNPVLSQAEAGSMALDVAGNRMLFIENVPMMANSDSIYSVDLATGVRSTVSDNVSIGSGPGFGMPADLVLVPAANPTRAIVSNIGFGGPNGPNYLDVNLATGTRTIFAPASGSSVGLPAMVPTWMHLDTPNNRILAINSDPESLFSMPLNTAMRTLVSGVHGGTGALRGTGMKTFGSAIEYDAVNGIAYTFGLEESLMAVDMVSGDRVQISH